MRDGVKQCKFIDKCYVPYYVIKDKTSQEAITPPMFIEKEKVEKVVVPSHLLFRDMALKTNTLAYYDSNDGSSNIKNIFKHPYLYNADMDIVDRYIAQFNEEFEPDKNYKLHKVFYDIEVDLMPDGFKKDRNGQIGYVGFPDEEEAPCPVNIITLIDGKTLEGYIFAHRNTLNSQLLDFEKNKKEHLNDILKTISVEDDVILSDIHMNFYNSEEETIEAFFKTMHLIDPDYSLAWNSGFDIKTLMKRLTKLYNRKKELKDQGINGYNAMLDTVCDKRYFCVKDSFGNDVWITPKAYYKQNKDKSIVDRMDEFTVLDGIIHVDQMLVYANVRKTSGMKESYALDAIAYDELGKEKLDYTGYTIKNLAWLNYKKFVQYNFRDTLLLMLLENKNLDMEMLQKLCEVTNTRKLKVFKKTISLKNFVSKFAEEQGFIMSNNKNAQYGNNYESFAKDYLNTAVVRENDPVYLEAFEKKENYGAYVGDPNLNDYCGIKLIGGKQSMFVFENVFDEDFSSLYPSIIQAYNLDKNTQLGKFFLIDDHIKEKLLYKYGYQGLFQTSKNDEAAGAAATSDLGPTIVDSLMSHDWNRIGDKYFDLPLTSEMINELLEE